jgi:hypothetical protein
MTQDEIIEMARDSGMDLYGLGKDRYRFVHHLEAFAKLVRNDYSNKHAQLWLKRIDEAVKAEREACAKVCESLSLEWEDQPNIAQAEIATKMDCAQAIRARGLKC